ncbi:MAG: cation diffusion facilitator family transporter [Myxococcota bacterium]
MAEAAHTHAHGYGHAHAAGATRRRLAIALVLAAGYMVAEVVGGLWTGSLALLADAGHMLSDTAALALALFAAWVASRPSGQRWTSGRARAEILAALAQGVALVGVSVMIATEAVERFGAPREVAGAPMLAIATGGLLVNLVCLRVLASGREASLNVRGAWLHVLSDALGSVGAMTAGGLIWAFGWHWADPAVSLVICGLVLFSAWHLLREAVDVLMEAAPREIDVEDVRGALVDVTEVRSVHDLHVWTVGSGQVALSCHVVVPSEHGASDLLSEIYRVLGSRFGIDHATIQVEPESFAGSTPRSVCNGACD